MALTDRANKYVDDKAPWVMAKEEEAWGGITTSLFHGYSAFSSIDGLFKTGIAKTCRTSEAFLQAELTWAI